MKTPLLILFGILSLLFAVFIFVYVRVSGKEGKRETRILSPVHVYTLGVFISVLLVFIPIYYTSYDFGDSHHYLRPFLIAVHNSFRIFILDGDFDIIVESVKDQETWLCVCFSLYTALLYVIAPVLTFTNVLSLFKNVIGELRYAKDKSSKYYIMSELNAKSIALAKSIRKNDKKAIIIFTDVFEQNEEREYELLTQARDMNAIFLKKDIAHVDIASRKGAVEVFLIGNDESENVSQAVRITTELNRRNEKHNVKVFVFSTKPGAAHIVDSIKYDNLLEFANEKQYNEETFKLRRIDERQQLIWNTLPEMNLFQLADRHDKTLSVLIAGFGSYGEAFFKALVWFCQFEGYKLQINILDKRGSSEEGKNEIESLIRRTCPELLDTNNSQSPGEAHYDIKIFPGVDILGADLSDMIDCKNAYKDKTEDAQRLKATNLAFVSLGDDDLNIEVSIYLRSLFDRIRGIVATDTITWEDEAVDIYSVVFDEQKSKILYNKTKPEPETEAETETETEVEAVDKPPLLVNHKDIPYHIYFIGSMSSQFDYKNIYDEKLETDAYKHHVAWLEIAKKQPGFDAVAADKREKKKYEQYEYFRYSSIAKELYQREIRENDEMVKATTCSNGGQSTCRCENCIRRKRSEHRRWNAYTRTIGFIRGDARADRALQHDKLRDWEELDPLDQDKD